MKVAVSDVKQALDILWEFGVYSFIAAFSLVSLFSLHIQNTILWAFVTLILFLLSFFIKRKLFSGEKERFQNRLKGLVVFIPVFPVLIICLISVFFETFFFSEGIYYYFNMTILLMVLSFMILSFISCVSFLRHGNVRSVTILFSLISFISDGLAALLLSGILLFLLGLVQIEESVISQIYSHGLFFTALYIGVFLIIVRGILLFYEKIITTQVKDPRDRRTYAIWFACILPFVFLMVATVLSNTSFFKEVITPLFLPKNFAIVLVLYLYFPRILGIS
jgi:hypothetical protein